MGVRPQALSDAPFGNGGKEQDVLTMEVRVVEPLGDKMDVYLSTARHSQVIAHVDAHAGLAPRQTLPIHVDLGRVHFFEKGDLGKNLLSAAAV
jgi:ABC-type sugar transport system ATPase subunit